MENILGSIMGTNKIYVVIGIVLYLVIVLKALGGDFRSRWFGALVEFLHRPQSLATGGIFILITPFVPLLIIIGIYLYV